MLSKAYLFKDNRWNEKLDKTFDSKNTLIVCFGCSDYLKIKDALDELIQTFTTSTIIACSTAGEIFQNELNDDSLSVIFLKFEKTSIKLYTSEIIDTNKSLELGINLAKNLNADDLKSIFILSDGLNINGSQLTKGINSVIKSEVIISGGLAADGDKFEKTWLLVDGEIKYSHICAVGFYGLNLEVKASSFGGWNKFGINRKVTYSKNNVLYSLDDKPALEVYKTYLGNNVKDLPYSGLFFPLMIKEKGYEDFKVRTILNVDENTQSITFAGDIETDSEVMFMTASFNDLIKGATIASLNLAISDFSQGVCIAISCVGRRLVLGQKTEDEIEAVLENLDKNIKQIGFYSYGEISPLSNGECDLHNQTMTLTFFNESI